MAMRKDMESYKAVLTNLYDKKEAVRVAAVEALRKKNSLSCVDHLIRALEYQEKKGRVHSQTAVAIRKLLTRFMGPNKKIASAQDWQNYWRINKKAIEKYGPNRKSADDDATGRRGGTAVTKELKLPEFFGEELVSDRICFVIDTSISMAKKDRVPPPGLDGRDDDDEEEGEGEDGRKGRTGVDPNHKRGGNGGGGASEGSGGGGSGGGGSGGTGEAGRVDPSTWPEKMRIRRVQAELSTFIRALPSDAKFTVISYSDEVRTWSGGLVDANSSNKSQAIKFVQRFNPKGQTHTDEALEAAFKIPNVRTIYLLTDGAPVRNRQTIDASKIVEWSEEVNRHRRVVINHHRFLSDARGGGELPAYPGGEEFRSLYRDSLRLPEPLRPTSLQTSGRACGTALERPLRE